MIKLENIVLASPEQMEFIIEGMRNPMNSWEKSDSFNCKIGDCDTCDRFPEYGCPNLDPGYHLGDNDHSLMQRLANAGTDHRKFMRMMPVYVRITAPLYWWKEFDTYKVGTVANSCSTMHKIQEKEFTLEDFSTEHLCVISKINLKDIIIRLNFCREKWILINNVLKESTAMSSEEKIKTIEKQKYFWWQMIQLLPSSYNQTRNVMLNYEVLANIYKSRKDHKLDEWREFCKWIDTLPYSELITCENSRGLRSTAKIVDEICNAPLEQVFKEYEADERQKIIKCKDCVYFDDEFCKATKQRARGWEFCDFAKEKED